MGAMEEENLTEINPITKNCHYGLKLVRKID